MAEAELLAELELAVWLVVQVQEEVQLQGRREWMRKIGVDHNNIDDQDFNLELPDFYSSHGGDDTDKLDGWIECIKGNPLKHA